jgi:hypothetical protein
VKNETQTYNTGAFKFYITDTSIFVPGPKYRVEINYDEDGNVEEVILHDATRMLVHLERESRDTWWIGFYPEADPVDEWDSDACFDIYRAKKRIEVEQR